MEKPSKFQKSVMEQIDKIGDAITLIEGLCDNMEKLDPVLVNDISGLYHIQPIIKFIIDHRKYTIWYNEMRNFIFQELTTGAVLISQKNFEASIFE